MILYNKTPFEFGYNEITTLDGEHSDMLMDFGILKIKAGETFESSEEKERAYLLMDGTVEFSCSHQNVEIKKQASRASLLDENPHVLHVSQGAPVVITAITDVELCVQKVKNEQSFEARIFLPDMVRSQRFGEGTMQDTSTRIVRTVFDASNAPKSAMVLGEVVNYPGKWSSYPPHNHPQPEIYHYRFPTGTQGFGFGQVGDDVFKITHESTLKIRPWVEHPQTAAPGYPMYYLWMIPHLPGDKFGPDSRQFLKEHEWLLDPKANIWPDGSTS